MINQWFSWEKLRRYILQSGLIEDIPRPAVTGWTDGSLSSADRPNYIKVHFYDDDSEAEVYNESVPTAYGIQVYVYKGVDNVMRARYPSLNYIIKDMWLSFVKNHAINHGTYSVDPLYIQPRAFLPLHPYVSGDWDVTVKPGWIIFGDQPYWFAGETMSLDQHRPTTGARYVLLSAGLVDIEGVMTVKMIVTLGTDKNSVVAPDDFPKIPAGTAPICAIKASRSKRKLVDKETGGDITDLRLSGGDPVSFTSGGSTVETDDSLQGTGTTEDKLGIAFGEYNATYKRLDLFATAPSSPVLDGIDEDGDGILTRALNVVQDKKWVTPKINLFGFGSMPFLRFFLSNGERLAPTALGNDQRIFGLSAYGYNGTDYRATARMSVDSTEDYTADAWGSRYRFYHTMAGTAALVFGMEIVDEGLNIPAGRTYNIDGVPHTHDFAGALSVDPIDVSSQADGVNTHFTFADSSLTALVTVDGILQSPDNVVMDVDGFGLVLSFAPEDGATVLILRTTPEAAGYTYEKIFHTQAVFTYENIISSVGDNPIKIAVPYVGAGAVIEEVYAVLGTAPSTTPVRINIKNNGASIFTGTQYVELALGTSVISRTIDFVSTALAKDDLLTMEIVQGDIAAADMSVHVRYRWALDSIPSGQAPTFEVVSHHQETLYFKQQFTRDLDLQGKNFVVIAADGVLEEILIGLSYIPTDPFMVFAGKNGYALTGDIEVPGSYEGVYNELTSSTTFFDSVLHKNDVIKFYLDFANRTTVPNVVTPEMIIIVRYKSILTEES